MQNSSNPPGAGRLALPRRVADLRGHVRDQQNRQRVVSCPGKSRDQDHHKDDSAMPKEQGDVVTNGIEKDKIMTKGWELQVLWKDGSTMWIKLNESKESNPTEVAECAVANCIQDEPAFAWWVSKALRWHNRMMAKVKKKCWRTTHKFGIRLPKSIEEAS